MEHHGITPPISLAAPTNLDLNLQKNLKNILEENKWLYECPIDRENRGKVLQQLQSVLDEYALHEAIGAGMTEKEAAEKTLQLRTFGSVRLGVYSSDADIDTLCIAPKHCSRESFFGTLPHLLEASPFVSELQIISDAFVPLLKFKINGISVDLLFVALQQDSIPENINVLDDKYLKHLDEPSVRSINGVRVTERILQVIPNEANFKMTLVAVKRWAECRGIYSNVLGFLGGVNWAILVARICQLYPNAVPATLFSKFFRVFHLWAWPTPVCLSDPKPTPFQQQLALNVWDPKVNFRDRLHLMPILTPAYPTFNSSYNVIPTTLRILKKELNIGATRSFAVESRNSSWAIMFESPSFFQRYKHYLRLTISTLKADEFNIWLGWIESRLRQLFIRLESIEFLCIHPYAKFFPTENVETEADTDFSNTASQNNLLQVPPTTRHAKYFFIGLELDTKSLMQEETANAYTVDLTSAIREFAKFVDQWPQRTAGMDLEVEHLTNKQLPKWLCQTRKHIQKECLLQAKLAKRSYMEEMGNKERSIPDTHSHEIQKRRKKDL